MTQLPEPSGSVDGRYYEVAKPRSLAERVVIHARDRIYEDFLRLCRPMPEERILDVGVSDVIGEAANVLERRYRYPACITAAGLGTAEDFRAEFPAVEYRQITAGEPLPFEDNAFEIATSNAVLEHVGSLDNQYRFLSELTRVGRRGFITVPNRFFPVEHHTGIPFLHWTDATFSLACAFLGKSDWSRSQSLIFMSKRRLRAVCPPGLRPQIGNTGILLGFCSANLYLYWDGPRSA